MSELDDYRVFRAVAGSGGFRAAARQLGVTTAGVSNSVARLEDRLGARLFTRTTRRVALTDEGFRLLERIAPLLRGIEAAEDEMRDQSGAIGGRVRISAPIAYGVHRMIPAIAALRERHPGIEVELLLEDDVVDLVAGGIDLTLRVGEPRENGLIARRLGRTRWCPVASPAYLARQGTPDSLEALADHDCVTYLRRGTRIPWPWLVRIDGKTREWIPRPGLTINDGAANRGLAMAGAGIVFDLSFPYEDDLASGVMVEVLPHLSVRGPPVNLVWLEGTYLPVRTRTVIEFLAERAAP